MFTNDITLAGDNSSSQNYSLISISGGKAVRTVPGLPIGEAKGMTISHEPSGKPGAEVDRHMVRLDRTVPDGTGATATVSTYVVIVSPRRIVTAAQTQDQVTQLKNFLTAANVTKVLNNEP